MEHAIAEKLKASLQEHPDFVYIAGKWFPSALLVEVNAGNLNLAEAILDMNGGGPLPTPEILEHVEMPEGVNKNLAEFSLDLALQEDKRFRRGWQRRAGFLVPQTHGAGRGSEDPADAQIQSVDYDAELLTDQMWNLVRQLDDEYSDVDWSDEPCRR